MYRIQQLQIPISTSHSLISDTQVDTGAVAETLNYKNPKSVANRVGQLKKKYDLPIGTAKSDTPKKASDASGANEPAIPATPSKQRVTKTRTPIKKNAVPKTKGKKAAKKEAPEDDADANEEVDEDMAVKSPSGESTSYDEAVFGKKEDEENSDEGV
jgi:hypothetical protein